MTPIESVLAKAMSAAGIKWESQKPVGWIAGGCQSRFRCRCGLSDDSWDDPLDEDCEWYWPGCAEYYVDFFVGIGNGIAIEIDDFATHHATRQMLAADLIREVRIKKATGWDFLRFKAKDVHNRTNWCVARLRQLTSAYEQPRLL